MRELVRTDRDGDSFEVQLKRAVNPSTNFTTYAVTDHPDGSESWTTTFNDGSTGGIATTTERGTDGSVLTTLTDGTTIRVTKGTDPRFGLQAPVPTNLHMVTGSHTLDVYADRTVTPANPTGPLDITTATEVVCVGDAVSGTTCNTGAVSGMTTVYDRSGETISRMSLAGRASTTTLDSEHRPANVHVDSTAIAVADADFTYYDATQQLKKGKLQSVTYSHGTESRSYQLGWDNSGNLTTVTDPLGRQFGFTPDGATRITAQTFPDDPNPQTVGFGYDDDDNLTSLDPPGLMTSNQHAFQFNGADLVSQYTAPNVGLNSHVDTFSYNGDLQLDELSLNHGGNNVSSIVPTYDSYGRLDHIDLDSYLSSLWTLTYNYVQSGNDEGKLASIVESKNNIVLGFGYDGALVDTVTWTNLIANPISVTYTYDDALRITQESVDGFGWSYQYSDGSGDPQNGEPGDGLLTGAGALSLTRDPDTGIVTSTDITDGNGTVSDVIGVNPFGELDSYSVSHTSGGLYDVSYTRDAIGRVVCKTESLLGQPPSYTGYHYDTAGHLAYVYSCQIAGDCTGQQFTSCTQLSSYTYDSNGNRNPSDCTYDNQDRLNNCGSNPNITSYVYTDWGARHYKSVGVGRGAPTTQYDYDLRGNLRTVIRPSPFQPINYSVDGLGRRVAKKYGSTLTKAWLYRDGLNPVAELDGSGTVEAYFIYGTSSHVPDFMIKGGSKYRLVTDQLGSVRLVVEVGTGDIAQKWDYDEWGVATFDASAVTVQGADEYFQPFGYAGGLYDFDTGLVRFGARDYDPETGRWTTKDPISFGGGQANLYAYVGGDPINFIDITGRNPLLAAAAVGAIEGAAIDIFMQLAMNGGNFGCIDWGQVGTSALMGGAIGLVAGPFASMEGAEWRALYADTRGVLNLTHAPIAEDAALEAGMEFVGEGYTELAPGGLPLFQRTEPVSHDGERLGAYTRHHRPPRALRVR